MSSGLVSAMYTGTHMLAIPEQREMTNALDVEFFTHTYPHSENDSADQEHLLVAGGAHGDGPRGEHHGRDDDGGLPAEPDTK